MAVFSRNEFAPHQGESLEHIFMAPASATVIYIGDALYLDPATSLPKAAGDMVDQKTEALNQDAFQMYFLGVAEQQSRSGDTSKIRICTRGRKVFDCESATYKPGDLVGMDEASSGTALENRKVAKVASVSLAIGRAAESHTVATTKLLVEFISTVMHGGLQNQVLGSSSGAI